MIKFDKFTDNKLKSIICYDVAINSRNSLNLGGAAGHGTGLEGPHHEARGCPQGLFSHLRTSWKHHSILRRHRSPCLREPPRDFPRTTKQDLVE